MDKTPSSNSPGTKRRGVVFSRKAIKSERKLRTVKLTPNPTENPRPVQHRDVSVSPHTRMVAKVVDHSPLSNAFRHIEPGWRNYIEYANRAANSGDEQMVKYMASYLALPRKEQLTVMPERVCDLSGVQPADLIGAVSRQYWIDKQQE